MRKTAALKTAFGAKAASASKKVTFVYSEQYYAQLRQIGANENRIDTQPDLTVQHQPRSFDKIRAEQASSLKDEHIDRIFSSAYDYVPPRPV